MAGRAAPRDFLRAKPEGNPEVPKENPVHPLGFRKFWFTIIESIL